MVYYSTQKRSEIRDDRNQADKSDTLQKGNLLRPLTSAHALVISQHVASRTHTLIGTKGVYTPEGTQQRILGALVDVWSQEERRVCLIYCHFLKSTFVNVSVTV